MHETSRIGNKILMHKEIEFQSKKIESQSKKTQENSNRSLYFHYNYNWNRYFFITRRKRLLMHETPKMGSRRKRLLMHETSKIENQVLMHKEIEFQSNKIESKSKRTQENSSRSLYFHCYYNWNRYFLLPEGRDS